MSMYGRDFEYANDRLRNSIVRTKEGLPVRLVNVSGDGSAVIGNLRGGVDLRRIPFDEVDCSPVPLGYVSRAGKTYYISRKPARGNPYRQGFVPEKAHIIDCDGMRGTAEISDSKIHYCIVGDHLTYKQAFDKAVRTENSVVPFHRHWAVSSDLNLMYKGVTVVGGVSKDNPQMITLAPEYEYLREYLLEAMQ